jgi:hypothetical protein
MKISETATEQFSLILEKIVALGESSGIMHHIYKELTRVREHVETKIYADDFIPDKHLKRPNVKDCLLAIAEISVLTKQAIYSYELEDVIVPAIEEVIASEMTKYTHDHEIVLNTCKHYEATGTPCYTKNKDGRLYIYRTLDNQLLPPFTYTPPDMGKIIDKYIADANR